MSRCLQAMTFGTPSHNSRGDSVKCWSLSNWLGLGSEEAGHVLGIEPSSVRGRLHRAHATLRELLGGIDG